MQKSEAKTHFGKRICGNVLKIVRSVGWGTPEHIHKLKGLRVGIVDITVFHGFSSLERVVMGLDPGHIDFQRQTSEK